MCAHTKVFAISRHFCLHHIGNLIFLGFFERDISWRKKIKKQKQTDSRHPPQNLPLFYKQPTPLDAKAHAKLGLKKNFGFGFTEGINAVPVNLIEMPQICHFYPIAFFTGWAMQRQLRLWVCATMKNLFLHSDNSWEPETYIPAYIRRYPFIFSEMPDNEQLTLCVDMDDKNHRRRRRTSVF